MGGMKSIIDQLGGVDITPLLSFDYEGYSYKKGVTTHMNGSRPWNTAGCVMTTLKATTAGKSDKDRS